MITAAQVKELREKTGAGICGHAEQIPEEIWKKL